MGVLRALVLLTFICWRVGALMAAGVSSLHCYKVSPLNKPSSTTVLSPCLFGYVGCMVLLQSILSQGISMTGNDITSGAKDFNIDFNFNGRDERPAARQDLQADALPSPRLQFFWGIPHARSVDPACTVQLGWSSCTSMVAGAGVYGGSDLLRVEDEATARETNDTKIWITACSCAPSGSGLPAWVPRPAPWGPPPHRGSHAAACGVLLCLSVTRAQNIVVASFYTFYYFGWSIAHGGHIWWRCLGAVILNVAYRGHSFEWPRPRCPPHIPRLHPYTAACSPDGLYFNQTATSMVLVQKDLLPLGVCLSFSYFRRRRQQYTSVVGMFLLR